MDNNTPKDKYYLRFACKKDISRILKFYDIHAHDNIRKREEELLTAKAESGSIAYLENEQGEIVASSISYGLDADVNGVNVQKWLEIGSTRVVLNGYPGLFDALTTAQVLRTVLVEPPEESFIAHMEHKFIQAKAEKLGWRKFSPSDEIKQISNKTINTGDLTDRSDNWYKFTVEGLPIKARYFMEIVKNPNLAHMKYDKEIEISFDRMKNFMLFKNAIEELANKDYGSVDNPKKNYGFKESRDKWLKRFTAN